MNGIIKRQNVRVEEQASTPSRRANGATHGQKSVRLLELEGRVHALELRCACGEVTVVELDYPDASQPKAK